MTRARRKQKPEARRFPPRDPAAFAPATVSLPGTTTTLSDDQVYQVIATPPTPGAAASRIEIGLALDLDVEDEAVLQLIDDAVLRLGRLRRIAKILGGGRVARWVPLGRESARAWDTLAPFERDELREGLRTWFRCGAADETSAFFFLEKDDQETIEIAEAYPAFADGGPTWSVLVWHSSTGEERRLDVASPSAVPAGIKARRLFAESLGEDYDPELHKVVSIDRPQGEAPGPEAASVSSIPRLSDAQAVRVTKALLDEEVPS